MKKYEGLFLQLENDEITAKKAAVSDRLLRSLLKHAELLNRAGVQNGIVPVKDGAKARVA